MNGNDNNIPSFPASVLEKYLNGELSAPEMHAVERAALEDPFLADALEGMALHRQLPGQKTFREDLGELQERLDKKAARPVRRLMSWKAAASIILLLGLGMTAYYSLSSKNREQAALAKSVASQHTVPAAILADTFKTSNLTKAARDSITMRSISSPYPSNTRPKTTIVIQPQAGIRTEPAPTVSNNPRPVQVQASPESWRGDATAKKDDRAVFKKREMPASVYKEFDAGQVQSFTSFDSTLLKKSKALSAAASDARGIPNQLVFSGKVTNQYNQALAGASLFMNGHNVLATVTDKNGNFSVRLPKSDSTHRLTVAYTGYEEVSMALNPTNRTGNLIHLQPQAANLNEVVVSGFGAKRKEVLRRNIDTPPKEASLVALPAEGWPAYNSYLESRKKTAGLDSTLAGVETISFIVNKIGALSSFKVDRSISPAHDSAAIRMIQLGPSWKLMKGRSARAVVNIIFP